MSIDDTLRNMAEVAEQDDPCVAQVTQAEVAECAAAIERSRALVCRLEQEVAELRECLALCTTEEGPSQADLNRSRRLLGLGPFDRHQCECGYGCPPGQGCLHP